MSVILEEVIYKTEKLTLNWRLDSINNEPLKKCVHPT